MPGSKLRSPIGVFFLALITGGIYYFYWFYKVNEEAAILNRERANPGPSLLACTVGILLVVPFFWTQWTTATRVGRATGRPSSPLANVVFSVVLIPFAALLYTLWLQGKLNQHGRR